MSLCGFAHIILPEVCELYLRILAGRIDSASLLPTVAVVACRALSLRSDTLRSGAVGLEHVTPDIVQREEEHVRAELR